MKGRRMMGGIVEGCGMKGRRMMGGIVEG